MERFKAYLLEHGLDETLSHASDYARDRDYVTRGLYDSDDTVFGLIPESEWKRISDVLRLFACDCAEHVQRKRPPKRCLAAINIGRRKVFNLPVDEECFLYAYPLWLLWQRHPYRPDLAVCDGVLTNEFDQMAWLVCRTARWDNPAEAEWQHEHLMSIMKNPCAYYDIMRKDISASRPYFDETIRLVYNRGDLRKCPECGEIAYTKCQVCKRWFCMCNEGNEETGISVCPTCMAQHMFTSFEV